MEQDGFLGNEQKTAAVIFAFLQADCTDSVYSKELLFVGRDRNLSRDINSNGEGSDCLLDGCLETDGGVQSNLCNLATLRPQVDLQWPHDPAVALREVAEGLREIAAQFDHNVVARATQNLSQNITDSPPAEWKYHLSHEVERAMRQSVGLENLSQERVMVALTLTVVKRVCKQTPQLLRCLFNTALHFLCRGEPGDL